MPLKSDLIFDPSKLDPKNISPQTHKLNETLIEVFKAAPRWYEIGIIPYRRLREEGKPPFPPRNFVEGARPLSLPSRDPGRQIPCRVFLPRGGGGSAPPKSLYYHIHGGGWVFGSEDGQDRLLQFLADEGRLVVVAGGYRLAPEHPFPEPNEDCLDVGVWLVDHAEQEFGVRMGFVGGESAGGHLSVCTLLGLLRERPGFGFKGVVLNYGMYNLGRDLFPGVYQFELPLVLDGETILHTTKAYLGNTPEAERRNPEASPFYAELHKLKLPPAIFPCGTLDPLLEDSIMMSTKWAMAGAESILKLYPGAPHGFTLMPPGATETTQHALDDTLAFILERI